MTRPVAVPGLLAEIAAVVPARLVRKLDQNPHTAEGWAWLARPDGAVSVTTDGNETVLVHPVSGLVSLASQISCTCLLAPRCLHVLAVVASLPIADETAVLPEPPAVPKGDLAEQAPRGDERITDSQRAAASGAFRALSELLSTGAQGAGAVLQGEVLRALHSCRAAGLPRLSNAVLRSVRGVRACRANAPEFELTTFAADLADALVCAHALLAEGDRTGWIGTARREYVHSGSLHLFGLFSEPVLTSSGYAGVITHLVADNGRFFTIADVAPGTADRIATAYAGAARLGGGTLSHRELSRSGLYVHGATASVDGRLGAGRGVQAARAGAAAWSDPVPAQLFAAPLELQLDRAFVSFELPSDERGAGASLVFGSGSVAGSAGNALLIAADGPGGVGSHLEAVAPSVAVELPFLDNLQLLARNVGLRLRFVGRIALDRPRRIDLLAIGPHSPASTLILPPGWGARCNLGLDRLQASFLSGAAGAPAIAARTSASADALLAVRRRVERLALGGRATLFPAMIGKMEQEARRLEADLMPVAAALQRRLAQAGLDRAPSSISMLATAFLAASEHCRVAHLALQRSAWEVRD